MMDLVGSMQCGPYLLVHAETSGAPRFRVYDIIEARYGDMAIWRSRIAEDLEPDLTGFCKR